MKKRTKRHRTIERLRRLFPGDWKWHPYRHKWYSFKNRMIVGAYSQLSPRYDGDDGNFTTIYLDQDGRTVML